MSQDEITLKDTKKKKQSFFFHLLKKSSSHKIGPIENQSLENDYHPTQKKINNIKSLYILYKIVIKFNGF